MKDIINLSEDIFYTLNPNGKYTAEKEKELLKCLTNGLIDIRDTFDKLQDINDDYLHAAEKEIGEIENKRECLLKDLLKILDKFFNY